VKRVVVGLSAALLSTLAAQAADLPVKSPVAACRITDYIRNQKGAVVIAPITSGSAAQHRADSTWIARRGLAVLRVEKQSGRLPAASELCSA